MNRQTKRRLFRNLNLKEKEIDNIAEYFRRENEAKNREVVVQFLALTIEALRLEFGFGQKRIDRYTKRVDSLFDSVNLDYVSFEDLLEEINLKPMDIAKLSDEKRRELKEMRLARADK